MTKFLTVLGLFCFLSSAFATSGPLDGKKYCRQAISDGLFGQPKGVRKVCLEFSNGVARDFNNTTGGNAPLSYPYQVNGNRVTFGNSEYEISLDRSALITISGSTIPGIMYALEVTNINDLHVPNSWLSDKINQNSIATKDQLSFLQKLMILEIRSKRSNQDSLIIINTNLSALGLPEIHPNPDIEIIGGNGIVGSVQGATIKDDSHLYCLPCEAGRNQYEFGIMNLEKQP